MKNMKDYEMFNELNSGTLRNASKKSSRYGQKGLAHKFRIYADEVEECEYDILHKIITDIDWDLTIYIHKTITGSRYRDITKYKHLEINGIDFVNNLIRLYCWDNLNNEQLNNNLLIEFGKPNFSFETRREANIFLKNFKIVLDEFIKFEEKCGKDYINLLKEIKDKLHVRNFYKPSIAEQYIEEEKEKKIKDFNL